MDPADALKRARLGAGLTQHALAARAGTSQATVSAYESGRKQPSLATLERLLAATGSHLAVVSESRPVREPSALELARAGRSLRDVLGLAGTLPVPASPNAGVPSPHATHGARPVTLPERVLALHAALEEAGIPHAFGGAIALAFATLDPRGTSDIDLNLFVPASEPSAALAALPAGIARPDGLVVAIARDGQVRLWWDETPIDLFFDYAPIHAQAAENIRRVPFEQTRIPVLGPVELVVFKVMFDRTRDWADVEAVIEAGTVDIDAVAAALAELLEPDDPRLDRLARLGRRTG